MFENLLVASMDRETVARVHPAFVQMIILQGPRRGSPMTMAGLRSLFRQRRRDRAIARALPDPARITSHRLRHTFATELLSGGMSLVGVMRLLGHQDIRMTLRYAAATPEIIAGEYQNALDKLATKYRLPRPLPRRRWSPRALPIRTSSWTTSRGGSASTPEPPRHPANCSGASSGSGGTSRT
jgi:hypothetical protein